MKLDSLSTSSACSPFTYLRSRRKLARLFEHSNGVLISAPLGSGRKTLVNQWLGQLAGKIKWTSRIELAVDDRSGEQSTASFVLDFENAGITSMTNDKTGVCVIELSELVLTHLQTVVPHLVRIRQRYRPIVLCERCHPSVYEVLCPLYFTALSVDDIALDEDEVADVVKIILGKSVPSRFYHGLFLYTQGWIPLVIDIISDFKQQPYQDATIGETRSKRTARKLIDKISNQFNRYHWEIISTISVLSHLPVAQLRDHGLGNSLTQATIDALTRGFLKIGETTHHRRAISCTVLSKIFLFCNPDIYFQKTLSSVVELLRHRKQYDVVIPAMLLMEQLESAKEMILEAGDQLIAQLRFDNLLQWITSLDSKESINDLLILMMAVRCSFYSGNTNELFSYVARLNNALTSESLSELRQRYTEKQCHRFISEFRLYLHALNMESNAILDSARDLSLESADQVMSLLRQALVHAENGEFGSAIPFVEAGIRITESNQQAPLHVIFSLIFIWVLVLTCRTDQAEDYIKKMRKKLSQSSVGFMGAYDWIDIMEILVLRVKGHIEELGEKLKVMLAAKAFTSDFQKHYLLTNVSADLNLAKGQIYEASHFISKMTLINTPSTKQSYWFASAPVMELTVSTLEGLVSPYVSHNLLANMLCSQPALTKQTEVVWMIKLYLYKQCKVDLDNLLAQLHEQCTQSGQWLRVLEIDVLRAVYLYEQGKHRDGISLFEKAFLGLSSCHSLGVLLDPFLLWGKLLDYRKNYSVRSQARALYLRVRPNHCFEDRQGQSLLPHEKLSKREQQILELMVDRKTSSEIADLLCISIATVRTHTQNIFRKLKVYNRAEAIVEAIRLNLVAVD